MTELARTIREPQRVLKLNGRTYKLDFDMQALAFAEEVYLRQYGRGLNVAEIIEELTQAKLTAVMAFAYGALRSAGESVTWEHFTKEIFTYDHFDSVFELVSDAILGLFPESEEAGDSAKKKA